MHKSLAAFLVAALAVIVFPRATGAAVLDQSDTAGSYETGADGDLGQTFTVGITGTLTSLELKMFTPGAASIDAMIATTSGGLPTSTILGQSIIATSGLTWNEWLTFNLATGIPVHAGEVLAIEIPTSGIGWDEDQNATYAGGMAYWLPFSQWVENPGGPNDFNFQTFVVPTPEPSSLGLLAIGFAGLCFAARRRKA
jgi:hypothetical protein